MLNDLKSENSALSLQIAQLEKDKMIKKKLKKMN